MLPDKVYTIVMRIFIYLSILLFVGLNTVNAQKVLSKKEIRKKKKIEQLETYINKPKFRFGSSYITSSTGKRMGSRGGLFDINGNSITFLEFLVPDINDNVEILTLDVKLESYTTIGSLKEGNLKVFFSTIIKNKKWTFKLAVQKSGRATLQIDGIYGIILKYDGRISSF